MAAHWAPQQVTIFTAVVYYKENNELKNRSYCIISDELDHNKHAVFVFNKLIINDIVTCLGSNKVEPIYYWSDGCGSQFKNKYTRSNLLLHGQDFGCTAEWNFFETAHGKGPVDGIGGAIKRSAWRSTMQGKDCPMDAKNFFEIAKRESMSVTVIYADKEEVRKTAAAANLDVRWAATKPIRGTRRYHQFKPSQVNDQLVCSVNSSYTQLDEAAHIDETLTGAFITAGDYILVEFQAEKSVRNFVGQVTEVRKCEGADEEYNVMFMRKRDTAGHIFGFPDRMDIAWITSTQILEKLSVPDMHGRGLLKFKSSVPLATD